jgi:hypothetical protein
MLHLGGVLASGIPMDQQFKVEVGVMLDGCGVGARPFVEPRRDPDIKHYTPPAAGGTSGAAGPLQCYTFCHSDPPSLNLSAYSIEANGVNANGPMSSESGAVLTLWDEYFGLYPSHRSLTIGPLRGGVPQLAVLNLSAHLAKLTSDINAGLHSPRNGIMITKPLPPDFSGERLYSPPRDSTNSHLLMDGSCAAYYSV